MPCSAWLARQGDEDVVHLDSFEGQGQAAGAALLAVHV